MSHRVEEKETKKCMSEKRGGSRVKLKSMRVRSLACSSLSLSVVLGFADVVQMWLRVDCSRMKLPPSMGPRNVAALCDGSVIPPEQLFLRRRVVLCQVSVSVMMSYAGDS